jgi:hypothetical protein
VAVWIIHPSLNTEVSFKREEGRGKRDGENIKDEERVPADAARTCAKKQGLLIALAICFRLGLFHAKIYN